MRPKKGSEDWEYFEGEDLAMNKASGIFYAVKFFPGIPPLNKTTKQKDKRKAKKELPRLIKEHLDRFHSGAIGGKPRTVGQAIEELVKNRSAKLRQKTLAKRNFYFDRIKDEMDLQHFPIAKLDEDVWTDRLERVRQKRDRTTYRDYQKHGNILMRYAYQRKWTTHLITFPNPDAAGAKVGVVFTVQELKALWEVMNETLRDQFVLGYECCMRLREALRLTWDRVDLETGEITLRPEDVKTGSKTGKGRKFIMSEQALERLRARKARQDAKRPSRYVFPSPSGKAAIDDNKTAWNNAKVKAQKALPSFQMTGTWHHLRHTAITRMLVEQGMNVVKVSEYVGTSIETLQRVYLHSTAEHTRGVTKLLRITD